MAATYHGRLALPLYTSFAYISAAREERAGVDDMDVACLSASFGESHFGSCSLGDARRTRRLVRTADLIMQHPGGTLPDKLRGNWADLIGLYRLAAAEQVTHQAVIAGHCRRTLERAVARAGVVLL